MENCEQKINNLRDLATLITGFELHDCCSSGSDDWYYGMLERHQLEKIKYLRDCCDFPVSNDDLVRVIEFIENRGSISDRDHAYMELSTIRQP